MDLRTHRSWLRFPRLAGWCGLLLYLGAFSPVGIGATALLAAVDPDHEMLVHAGATGPQLVLHHQACCAGHHHRAVARMLSLFAQPAGDTNPDHVLQFSSAAGVKRDSQVVLPSVNQSGFTVVVFAEPVTLFPIRPFLLAFPPRPPPDAGGQLLALRSTVLLI